MIEHHIEETEEGKRIAQANKGIAPWRLWGPYLSERQWGTVREDYSQSGDAWEYFPHDHARSRAYRWGEDGLAGISDEKQRLCFSLALWNGNDPILKERLFGLTNHQGNHGEDVKEYYFYLDNTPSHSYMKYLYKYPQRRFPYEDLIETNGKRSRTQFEYELLDTGIFNENRYFDVFVEYAKNTPEEIYIRITACNRGPEEHSLLLLPTLFFRNTWSWKKTPDKPSLKQKQVNNTQYAIEAVEPEIGAYTLYCPGAETLLFTDNVTNAKRLFNTPNESGYVKDAFHDYFVTKDKQAVNPEKFGTKACAVYPLTIRANGEGVIYLKLSAKNGSTEKLAAECDAIITTRKKEADQFYKEVTPYPLTDDMRNVQRQAFSGLLWNKQCYHYNVKEWLDGDPLEPAPPESRKEERNSRWYHIDANDIFSMPDKWEYPWFAAWDTAFHTVTLAMIDPAFAKSQLILLTREWYMAPEGQIPAYEWNFSDVNPPVQAWAAMRVYQIEHLMYGREDRDFLERMFQKLVINFTWWVNRKDKEGRNIFEGGFLGLDNIGAFDRSLAPPPGTTLGQTDATGWMGMFCLNCLQIALELAAKDPTYEDMATKFFEHFVYIADAINNITGHREGLWDDARGFYYSLVTHSDGSFTRLHQDNMASIVPLFAVATNDSSIPESFPNYRARFDWFIKHHPEMLHNIADLEKRGVEERILLAFTSNSKLTRVLQKVLDENQFLSPFGVRSVSKWHKEHPFSIYLGEKTFTLDYEPAEATSCLFGGNSNWRGPIWFPLNFLLIESLQKFHYYYGENLTVECPIGSKKMANLWDVSSELTRRLINIFLKDKNGHRPLYGGITKFQDDPHWKDYIFFHEYFHGDDGAGLGASNQTGWTALVAKLIQQYGKYSLQHESPQMIESEKIGKV